MIAPTNGTLTQLAFSSPTDQQLGYLSSSNYIFENDSVAASPPPFVGGTASTVYPNDTFNATDSTADGNTVTIASNQTYLLAMLPITTLTQLDPQAGDTFMVSLAPGSGNGSSNGGSPTYFNVLDFNPNSPTYLEELSATPYTSTSGTVTILPASVPEPASIVSGLIAMLILAPQFAARRRSERGRADPSDETRRSELSRAEPVGSGSRPSEGFDGELEVGHDRLKFRVTSQGCEGRLRAHGGAIVEPRGCRFAKHGECVICQALAPN